MRIKELKKLLTLRDLRVEQAALKLGLLRGHKDYTRFIILSRSRSGSNYLRTLLAAHPAIVVSNEILREMVTNRGVLVQETQIDWNCSAYRNTPELLKMRGINPVKFLETIVFRKFRCHVKAVGFKLFYCHAAEPPLQQVWPWLAADSSIHILHLKRRNLLRVHLSFVQALRSNQWLDTVGRRVPQEPVTLDAQECLSCFEQTRTWEAEADLKYAGHPKLDVSYEELTKPNSHVAEEIQSFLHLPILDLKPKTHKQSQLPLSAAITNYHELKAIFAGTPWYIFFEE